MKKSSTPSAQWDAMTDEQKIEWLAKLEGYTNDPERVEAARPKNLSHSTYDNGWLTPSGKWIHELNRKYLTDWNHWRQVEEKIMENELVFAKYTADLMWRPQHEIALYGGNRSGKVVPPCMHAFTADLLTRAKALFLALHAK